MSALLQNADEEVMQGLSLLELMVALVIVAVLASVALPAYHGYSTRAHRTSAQSDLLRCAQGMERHAMAALGYALAVDTNGDGAGDADTGAVSDNICALSTDAYRIAVVAADAGSFLLRATPVDPGDGALEVDSSGARRWDRNDDDDFEDADEWHWN